LQWTREAKYDISDSKINFKSIHPYFVKYKPTVVTFLEPFKFHKAIDKFMKNCIGFDNVINLLPFPQLLQF
jgi:hypothetical protein